MSYGSGVAALTFALGMVLATPAMAVVTPLVPDKNPATIVGSLAASTFTETDLAAERGVVPSSRDDTIDYMSAMLDAPSTIQRDFSLRLVAVAPEYREAEYQKSSANSGKMTANLRTFRPTANAVYAAPPAFGAAVPEPATWGMMIVGFGAIGGMIRASRRRDRVTA